MPFEFQLQEVAMPSLRLALTMTLSLLAGAVLAQNAPNDVARATIERVSPDGASLAVRTRGGEERAVRLSDKTIVMLVVPASLADVKPGVFIGVAALPGEGGELKAMEVHIFPESLRGIGEGHRPFDLAPGSTMTNGNVDARVNEVDGPKLTVAYKGGEQTIVVGPGTPIVELAPGARSDLKPGAAIVARGTRQDDGSNEARYLLVGKDGLVPPL
jgi:hypothetical protein